MKKYALLSLVLSLCVLLCACAGGARETTATTVLFDAQTTTGAAETTALPSLTTEKTAEITIVGTEATTTTAQICYFGTQARVPSVTVLLDGEVIEPWNSMLYSHTNGVMADGFIMFMDPPYDEFPEYDLANGVKITVDGAQKTTLAIRDAVTHAIIGKFETQDLAENIKNTLGAGRYIAVFDAKNYGTGTYANDCIVYSYYFYVNVR